MTPDLETLRYPVGKFSAPDTFSNSDLNKWLEIIAELPKKLRDAVHNLSDAQLDSPYREDGWTIRQVVHHLPDSHLNAYCRFKLALTEDNPTIRPYLEDRWAELPDSKSGRVDVSLDLLEAVHKCWLLVLYNMSEKDFQRTFYHPENKVTRTLAANLALYAWHSRHHIAHITELKKRKGWG